MTRFFRSSMIYESCNFALLDIENSSFLSFWLRINLHLRASVFYFSGFIFSTNDFDKQPYTMCMHVSVFVSVVLQNEQCMLYVYFGVCMCVLV